MQGDTLLFRAIPGTWEQGGEAAYRAFHPKPAEIDKISVYNSELVCPRAVFSHYGRDPRKPAPKGVLAVTADECCDSGLEVQSSPDPDPENPIGNAHVSVQFAEDDDEKIIQASALLDCAWDRGWLYP